MSKLFLVMFFLLFLTSGCVGWTSAPSVETNCSLEQTWSVALASLQEFELRSIDQKTRVIETEWIKVQTSRLSGLMNRNLNEERARFVLTIEPENTGQSVVTVKQIREFWSPQGVQSRSWRQIPANEDQERQLAARIQVKLKRAPC